MITLREQFIAVFEVYAVAAGVAEGTLSDRLLRSGARFKRIREGSDISTGTYERVMQWFSDHWPEDAGWPEDVERPKSPSALAASHDAAGKLPEAAE
ncbi:hypothetical protein [Hoeflea sp.]|uniref:hypothetical protein n=1 Tax=Hoeflea sp. TaxID=1940281 RepID=UPI0037493BAA